MIKDKAIAALYCVYEDDYWLRHSYDSIYDVVDTIFFFVSSKAWYGPTADNSKLLNTIHRLPDPYNKKQLIQGDWSTETEQRNFSLALAQYTKHHYGFIVDSDEIYDPLQLFYMFNHAIGQADIGCWHARWYTYWKSIRYRIDPIEPYDPPVFVKLGSGGFVETRNFRADRHELIPPTIGMCHHLSYARPDELIKRKHIAFSGHSQSMFAGWYENVWKKWDQDHNLTNLHPVTPTLYGNAIEQPLSVIPPILYAVYEKGLI